MRSTLRFRLTVSLLVVLGGALLAFSGLFYVAGRHVLYAELDASLQREAEAIGQLIEEHTNQVFNFEAGGKEVGPDFEKRGTAYFQFWRPDGTVIIRSPSLGHGDLPQRPAVGKGPAGFFTTLPDGRPGRALQHAILARWESHSRPHPPPAAERRPVLVVVARGTESVERTLVNLRLWLLALGVVATVLTGGAAAWLVRRGLQPATALASEIGRIDEHNLSGRLSAEALPRELEAPVTKLNELFARLEESFSRERRFTADVSHELRTPLAGLRMILEVVASRQRSPSEYRAAVEEARAVVDQMQRMVENLLMLAQLDARQIEVMQEPVDLRGFVDECWRPYAAAAAERGLTFTNHVPETATLRSDRDKLRVVVANLLSNAVEYTAAGGQVVVETGADGVVLDVCDSGPPIPDAALVRLFDRFYRAESSRTKVGVHCGIGLSLVRALCDVLGFGVEAANLPDGQVRFRLTMLGHRERLSRSGPAAAASSAPRSQNQRPAA